MIVLSIIQYYSPPAVLVLLIPPAGLPHAARQRGPGPRSDRELELPHRPDGAAHVPPQLHRLQHPLLAQLLTGDLIRRRQLKFEFTLFFIFLALSPLLPPSLRYDHYTGRHQHLSCDRERSPSPGTTTSWSGSEQKMRAGGGALNSFIYAYELHLGC